MAQNEYTGICVGGPQNGKMMTAPTKTMRSIEPVDAPSLSTHSNKCTDLKYTVYRYAPITFYEEKSEIGMWVADDLSPFEALVKIIEHYNTQPN